MSVGARYFGGPKICLFSMTPLEPSRIPPTFIALFNSRTLVAIPYTASSRDGRDKAGNASGAMMVEQLGRMLLF